MFLRRASKSVFEVRFEAYETERSKAKEFGIASSLHVVYDEEEARPSGDRRCAEKKRRKDEVTSKRSDNGYA